jgi:hypothetical protein
MGEFQLILGIIIGMYSIVGYGARKLQKIYEILGKRTQNDYKNMWSESYKKIYFSFYEELINRMNKILTRYDDVVVYCHLVTMNQFKYYHKDDLREETMQELLKNLRLELDGTYFFPSKNREGNSPDCRPEVCQGAEAGTQWRKNDGHVPVFERRQEKRRHVYQ